MVLASINETIQTICMIVSALIPILLVVIALLWKKGKISTEQKETAEEVIKALGSGVEAFKGLNKPESKNLTEIIKAKAEAAEVGQVLDSYLEKFNLNNSKKEGVSQK